MPQTNTLLGIDIGTTAVRLCRLRASDDGYELDTYDQVELVRARAAAQKRELQERDALVELVERNELAGSTVAITPPAGNEFVHRSTLQPTPQGYRRSEIAETLFAELPSLPSDMYLQAVPRPGSVPSSALVFGSERFVIDDRVERLRQLGLKAKVVDGSMFALYNVWSELHGAPEDGNTLLLDIGQDETRFILVNGEKWVAHGQSPLGGNHLNLRLQSVLELDLDEAESYKLGGSDSADAAIVPRDVHEILVSASNELARRIASDLAAAGVEQVDQILVSGRTAALQIARQALADTFQAYIDVLHVFDKLTVSSAEFAPEFLRRIDPEAAVAVGLALRSGGHS